jgi:hypothetical protein
MPPPSVQWVFTDQGWALVIGPYDRPQPMDPSLEGGKWTMTDSGWYFVYATGDKPRPPGPITPPGTPPIDPPDPPIIPPDAPVNAWVREPAPGQWGYYNSADGGYSVYRPAADAATPKSKRGS